MNGPSAVAAGALLHLRVSSLTPMAVISSSVTPVGMGLLLYAGDTDRAHGSQQAVSIVFIAIWGTMLIQSVIAVVQERNWGTMATLATTPSGVAMPILGRVLASVVHGLVSSALVLTVLMVLVPSARTAHLGSYLLALVPVLLGYVGVALAIVSWIVRYRYASGGVNGLFEMILLLSGSFVAAATFPNGLRQLGQVFPSVRVVELSDSALWVQSAVGTAWLAGGLLLLARASDSLRKNGKGFLQ